MDGIEFLEKAGESNPDIPIIMISGHGNIETAVEAVKKGAYDYISKPPDLNRLADHHPQCNGQEHPWLQKPKC